MSASATLKSFEKRETAERFFALASPFLGALDRFLVGQQERFEPELRGLVEYALSHSGKRLRPIALFLAGADGRGEANEDMIRAAAVVEMVHLATLVHDDILDEADVRHKQETVSRRFGVSSAVLLGDALFAQALEMASEFQTTEVCRLVSGATRKICAGEIEQTLEGHSEGSDIERYFRIIERKTAVLFEVSCRLGALLGFPGAHRASTAGKFGLHIGLAYQIYDDLVDVIGSEAVIGKTLGTDLASGKRTLPLLLLFENLKMPAGDGIHDLDEGYGTDLRTLIKDSGVVRKVGGYFESEIRKAQAAASSLADEGCGLGLVDLASFVERRFASLAEMEE